MNSPHRTIRALGLCSGGLDSMLAGLVLREQGIAVEWVTFETPFFAADKARKASRLTGTPLRVQPIFPTYLAMLRNPRAGYGRQMNPCMDCHALMFRLAGEIMRGKFRNSFETPEPMVPGEVTPIHIDLRDRFHAFKAGHRIMVHVQSSWFPAYDRNPQQFMDIYRAQPGDYRVATQTVYRSAEHPSHLVLGVLR